MSKNTIRDIVDTTGISLVSIALLCVMVDLYKAALAFFLLGLACVVPVKRRLEVGCAGVVAASVLIIAWATSMNPDREAVATYLSIFTIFMVGTGLSRAAAGMQNSIDTES